MIQVKPADLPDLLTIVVKSFNRPKSLAACLASVKKHVPGVKTLVLDDSTFTMKPDPNADTWMVSKEWLGLNEGKNRLVDACPTPFCGIIEDDYILTPKSNFFILLDAVKNRGVDIAGGQLIDMPRKTYRGQARTLTKKGRTLHITIGYTPQQRMPWKDLEAYRVDYVGNFFVARTDFLRKVRWDTKVAITSAHADFFLDVQRAGGVVVHTPLVQTQHWPDKSDPVYRRFRDQKSPGYLKTKHQYDQSIIKKLRMNWRPKG